jgi:hypothetical protein
MANDNDQMNRKYNLTLIRSYETKNGNFLSVDIDA